MKFNLFNDLENTIKNSEINNFLKEISEFLNKFTHDISNLAKKEIDETECFREENCLYHVVEGRKDSIFLQNINTGKIFEETKLSDELKNNISTDFVLRYKNGEYLIEEDLTEKFFDSLVDVKEYERLQQNFINTTDLDTLNSNARFKILSRNENNTVFYFVNDSTNTIEVPNALVPFFADENKVFYFDNDNIKFEIDYDF